MQRYAKAFLAESVEDEVKVIVLGEEFGEFGVDQLGVLCAFVLFEATFGAYAIQ